MAIIFSPLFHKMKGKIGNLILYGVKGQTRVRSNPVNVSISWSPAQELQQNRFRTAVFFYRANQDTLLPKIWRIAARNMIMSGYNLFLLENMPVFNAGQTIGDYSMLHIRKGKLEAPQFLQITGDGNGKIHLMWKNPLPKIAGSMSDRLHAVWLDGNGNFSLHVLSLPEVSRRDEEAVLLLPQAGNEDLHLYVYFSNKEEQHFSPDRYFYLPAIE